MEQTFTDQIREMCRKTGITIQKLFPRLGLNPQTFYTWEKKPERLSEASLKRMDKGLDELGIEINRLRLRINTELAKLAANKSEAA